jgi:hypothetical protein
MHVRKVALAGLGLVLSIGLLALPPPVFGEGGPEMALDRAVRLAAAARRRLLTEDRCPFSPSGVVMRVGSDPEALAAFVRERIGYEPYLGVVRGARGTLAAGAGSDWDRAVLLAALLAEAGYESLLIVAHRTEAERAARIEAFLAGQGRERALGAAGSRRAVRLPPPSPLLAEVGVSLPNRDLAVARGTARWRRLLDESHDAAAGLMPSLSSALGASGAEVGRTFDAWRRVLLSGAAERVLVEAGGRTLHPGPDPSNAPAPGNRAKSHPAPPADRMARLGVRLCMAVVGEGAPKTPVVLMDESFPVGSLFGKPIRFQIAPDGSAGGGKPANEWGEDDWFERLGTYERFQAMLEVDRLWLASDAFDIHGRTFKVKNNGQIESAKGMGRAVGRGFGGFGGGGARTPEKPKTTISALTLELTLELPGTEPIRTRRLIWGNLRRDVSPVYLTDLVVFGGPVGPETLFWRAFDVATANVRFSARILSSDDRYRMARTDDMRMLHQMLQDWQLARLGIADRLLSADEGLAILGGPALVMKTAFLVPDPKAKRINRRTVVDIVHDGLLLVPRRAGAETVAVRANMTLGVASTVLESCLVRERRPTTEVEGAFAAFERAAVRGDSPVVARAPELDAVSPAALTRWALADAPTGRVLLFSCAGGNSWFDIDPATGATIGRGGGGEGQSMAEYKAAIDTAMKNLKCMLVMMNGARQGQDATENAYEWTKCITGFDPEKASSYTGFIANYQDTMHGLELWGAINDAVSACEDLVERAQKKAGD